MDTNENTPETVPTRTRTRRTAGERIAEMEGKMARLRFEAEASPEALAAATALRSVQRAAVKAHESNPEFGTFLDGIASSIQSEINSNSDVEYAS